jgi:hypothetical protein
MIRQRRRNRARSRIQKQAIADQKALKSIKNSYSASAASWGGTRCPGCGIPARPAWVAPFVEILPNGRIHGQHTICSGPGKTLVKCPGERDWQ